MALTMKETVTYIKSMMQAPHLAYAQALSMFSEDQRWAYFKIVFRLYTLPFIAFAILFLIFRQFSLSFDSKEVLAAFTLSAISLYGFYFYHVHFVPYLLEKVGGWFNGKATREELRSFSVFSTFVMMVITGMTFALCIPLFFISPLIVIAMQAHYVVYYVKGLQHVHQYDLMDAVFTILIQYLIMVALLASLTLTALLLVVVFTDIDSSFYSYVWDAVRGSKDLAEKYPQFVN